MGIEFSDEEVRQIRRFMAALSNQGLCETMVEVIAGGNDTTATIAQNIIDCLRDNTEGSENYDPSNFNPTAPRRKDVWMAQAGPSLKWLYEKLATPSGIKYSAAFLPFLPPPELINRCHAAFNAAHMQ